MKNQDEIEISLRDFVGTWVVLYFYPKDSTTGCTIQACEFTEDIGLYRDSNTTILGVSPDSATKHKNFISKYNIAYSLLVDNDKEMLKNYGAWGLKKNFGKEYEGVLRSTFIINPNGDIAKIYNKVKAKGHSKIVLEDLKILQDSVV